MSGQTPSTGKTKHKKPGKESQKRQARKFASEGNEYKNDKNNRLLGTDFQMSNRNKLDKQLANMERNKSSHGGLFSSDTTISVRDKSEEDARIAAAEAMSVLASGCNLVASSSQEGLQRPSSPSSRDSSSGNDDALVIDCDANVPSTTGTYLQMCRDVQEDTVSSSSPSKRALNARKSPAILSILENRASSHTDRLVIQDANYFKCDKTVQNQSELVHLSTSMNLAMPTVKSSHVPVEITGLLSTSTATHTSHKPTNSVPLQIHSQMGNIISMHRSVPPEQLNSVQLAKDINDLPALKVVDVDSEDYCPPFKRSRTTEAQIEMQSMEVETLETIPDLHSLSINSSTRQPEIAVNRSIGSVFNQGSVTHHSTEQGKKLDVLVHEKSYQTMSENKQNSPVSLNSRLVCNPDGSTKLSVSPDRSYIANKELGKLAAMPSDSHLKTQGQENGQIVHAHAVALHRGPLHREQAQSTMSPYATASTNAYKSSLPLLTFNLSSNPGGQGKGRTDASASSIESDEASLQTAQKQALQRLSENLARATPKERAFMLGQIQAIVTLQRASQMGLQGFAPTLETLSSIPITAVPLSPVPTNNQPPMLSKDLKTSSASSPVDGDSLARSWHVPEGTQPARSVNCTGVYLEKPATNDKPMSCARQSENSHNRSSITGANNSVVDFKVAPPNTQSILNNDSPRNQKFSVTQMASTAQHNSPSVITSGGCVTSAFSEKTNGLYTTSPGFVGSDRTKEPIRLMSVKKHQPIPQDSGSGSHLPFKKRRMAEYAAEVSRMGESNVSDGGKDTFHSSRFSESIPRPMTATSNYGNSVHSPRVPNLNDIKTALQKDEDGDIPLHIAAAQGNLPAVDRYIGLMKLAGASVDVINKDRQTPLHIAVVTNNTAITERLLRAGACVNYPNNIGQSAIHLATKGGYTNCLSALISSNKQAQLDKKDFEGYSPLHLAVQQSQMEVIHTLLEHGADTNVQDGKSGRTPLFHAAENNQYAIVNMLLKVYAKVNVMNYAGNTAVMAASSRGHKEVVTLLMQYGADTKGTNIGDMTSKGPPVRSTTNAALRQTVSTPSPTPDSDDSSDVRMEKASRNKHSARRSRQRQDPL